ncbi:hypothetical protein [Pseudomonas aeruginosa]|uniref:hypothetical protein n=1 Tax=Pseudomonas aeruginosa TaxID=287 RepID=UPI0021E2FF26|nr:hypothetical protein [Pseudomonas aeruginosa]
MSSTQLIEQCTTRLRGIVEALDNIHDISPHRWSTDLDDVHSSAESLLALIKDQAPTQAAQDLALRTIAEYPCPEQDNMTAANMRQVAADAITGALAFGAQASQPPAADHWLRPFYDIGRAEGQRTQDLAMLVRMLASSLKRHAPESNLVARATNYLAAKGLAGTRGPECNYCGATARSMEAWQTRTALAQSEGGPVIGCLCGMPMSEGHHSPDGCCNLEEFAPRAQAEQAEAERPEVVGVRYEDGTILSAEECGIALEVCAKVQTPLMTVAQHDRIAGELRADRDSWAKRWDEAVRYGARIEEQRDAALARVASLESKLAELEKQDLVDVPGPDEIHQMAFEEGQPADDGDGYLFSAEEFDLFVQRLLDSCAAPVAQAQHSVPEVSGIGRDFAFPGSVVLYLRTEPTDDDLRAIHDGLRSLAAAPGKEVPQAWLDVQAERKRQVEVEGWTPEHDDAHSHGQMARAAACYALAGSSAPNDGTAALLVSLAWPWDEQWWKPSTARRDMVKACALGLAEIERLDRAAASQGGPSDA